MSYWQKRAEQRLLGAEKMTEAVIRNNVKVYNQALNDVQRQIDGIYEVFGTRTGINYAELKGLMSQKETESFYLEMENRINMIVDDKFKSRLLARQDMRAYKTRISRLEALKEEIYIRTKEVGARESLNATNHLTRTTNETFNRTMFDTQQQIGQGFNFNGISDTRMNELLRTRWSGLNYSDRIWKNTTALSNKLNSTITRGFLAGKPQQVMIKEIRGVFDVSKYNATRLIRTETNYFANQGELLSYEESGIEKYEYLATLDSRTSDICQELDGKKFKVSEANVGVNYPPMHANCRSTTVTPIKDTQGLKRRARDREGESIKVPMNMSYKEWKEKYGDT